MSNNKCLLKITTYFWVIIVFSSCAKNEFFGIEEEPSIDIATIYNIAMSEEYVEYEMACLKFMYEINNIDTTQKNIYTIIDGKPVYVVSGLSSYKEVLQHRNYLKQKYPELQNVDVYEMKQIQSIAFSSNSTLKDLSMMYIPNSINRTKGSNDETMASLWLNKRCNNEGSGYSYDSGEQFWRNITYLDNTPGYQPGDYFTFILYLFSDAIDAVDWSREKSISTERETGGYVWQDDSAVGVYHEQALNGQMAFPPMSGNPVAYYDFHFHPSGDLVPSEKDWQAWGHMPTVYHYIFNYEGYCSCFWQ